MCVAAQGFPLENSHRNAFAHPVHVAEEERHVHPLQPPKVNRGAALQFIVVLHHHHHKALHTQSAIELALKFYKFTQV